METDTRDYITIPQVARNMGVLLDKKTSWKIGSSIAAKYHAAFGKQPIKGLRPKTNGLGSHCFALYPPNWQSVIENEISIYKNSIQQPNNSISDLFTIGN